VTLYFFAMVDKDSPLFTLCVILTFCMVTAAADLDGLVTGDSTVGATVGLSFFAGVVEADDGLATDVTDAAEASVELGSEESELLIVRR
jgi:hypothetical protein